MAKKLVLGLNDCTNEEYHADREFISSSVLKVAYDDIAEYHRQYVLGQTKKMEPSAALEFGTLAHVMILEPHLLHQQYAFFDGWKRHGQQFENFRAQNPGKIIITVPVKHKMDQLLKVYKRNKRAVELFENGVAEQTLCVEIDGVKIKTRFDYIKAIVGEISDVKTTGYSSDHESFKITCEQLKYALSGALYTWAAELFYEKPFDFYFNVLSKKDETCDVYKLSDRSRVKGRQMIQEAIRKIKKGRETGIWVEEVEQKAVDAREYEILEV